MGRNDWKYKPAPRLPRSWKKGVIEITEPKIFPLREVTIIDENGKIYKYKFDKRFVFKCWKEDHIPMGGLSILKKYYNLFESLDNLMRHCQSVVERPIIKHGRVR